MQETRTAAAAADGESCRKGRQVNQGSFDVFDCRSPAALLSPIASDHRDGCGHLCVCVSHVSSSTGSLPFPLLVGRNGVMHRSAASKVAVEQKEGKEEGTVARAMAIITRSSDGNGWGLVFVQSS